MSTTVQTILDGAYNRASNNDPGKLAQDPELIAHLSRVYQRAWPLVARARPDQFSASALVSLIGAPPSGSLPTDVIDILGAFNAFGVSVWIIPITDQARTWLIPPCVYRRGMSLVSRAKPGDPLAGDTLSLVILDAPPALVNLTDTLDPRWPVRHVQLLTDVLAVYLSVKDSGRDAGDRQAILAELQASVSAFSSEFGLVPADVEWIHAEAEHA